MGNLLKVGKDGIGFDVVYGGGGCMERICTEDLSIIEMLMLISGHRRIKWNVIRSIWGSLECFS